MEKLPKVIVIMSTYNGEKFIKEQIDSILAQKEVDIYLHIFDDCSKDNTVEIVREYEKKDKRVVLHINEKNKNFTYNFIDGLFTFKDNQEYDYYAFADQDDYWMPNKLISAVNKIKETDGCTLYCSNLRVVDSELKTLGKTMIDENYQYNEYDEIYCNLVTGCTAVFDKEFKNLVTKYYPVNLIYHDYWVGLIANYVKGAHFIYDTSPDYILYRQHGNNAEGAKTGFLKRFIKFIMQKDDRVLRILKIFLMNYDSEINEKYKEIILKFINYKNNGNKKFLMKNVKTNFIKKFKFKLKFNKYI